MNKTKDKKKDEKANYQKFHQYDSNTILKKKS